MKPAESVKRELYIPAHDDGSTRDVVFVAVDGLPGLYPEEPSLAGVAEMAKKHMAALRKEYGLAVPEAAIKEKVAAINDERRITKVDMAWQAARYERTIRQALPPARAVFQLAQLAFHNFIVANLPPAPVIEELFVGLQTGDSADTIRNRFVEALEPEQRSRHALLKARYEEAFTPLATMVSNLHERSDQAVFDYDDKVDWSEEVEREDRQTYAAYLS